MKCWINHNKLKHYLLRDGGVQLFVTCGISSIPPIFLSPILTPHWQMNLFFLPCESIKIRILVILEATYPKVSLTEKKVSVLLTGIPHVAPGMCHCHPAFTSSCHGHSQGWTSLFFIRAKWNLLTKFFPHLNCHLAQFLWRCRWLLWSTASESSLGCNLGNRQIWQFICSRRSFVTFQSLVLWPNHWDHPTDHSHCQPCDAELEGRTGP